jgi:DNA-binding beta-propeller fold protein YncE
VVNRFYRGLGRPQGMAFDAAGNLYVAASLSGHRGVVRITPEGQGELFVSGYNIVGLAFSPRRTMIVATNNSLVELFLEIEGQPLLKPNDK